MKIKDMVERVGRPGLLGLAGRAREKSCARELRAYFSGLGADVLGLRLETVAEQPKDAAMVRHAVEMKVRNLLRRKSGLLEKLLAQQLEASYELASKIDYRPLTLDSVLHAEAWDAKVERRNKRRKARLQEAPNKKNKIDRLGDSGKSAAEWAADNAAELVTGINQTTIDDLADAVSKGIAGMEGPDGTSRLIRKVVDGMEKTRADMIAATEMNRAMSAAALDKMERLGIEYKQIILVDDACDICQENADEDPIPVDDSYPSGDDGPPFHPNCRCAVTGARPPEEE